MGILIGLRPEKSIPDQTHILSTKNKLVGFYTIVLPIWGDKLLKLKTEMISVTIAGKDMLITSAPNYFQLRPAADTCLIRPAHALSLTGDLVHLGWSLLIILVECWHEPRSSQFDALLIAIDWGPARDVKRGHRKNTTPSCLFFVIIKLMMRTLAKSLLWYDN